MIEARLFLLVVSSFLLLRVCLSATIGGRPRYSGRRLSISALYLTIAARGNNILDGG